MGTDWSISSTLYQRQLPTLIRYRMVSCFACVLIWFVWGIFSLYSPGWPQAHRIGLSLLTESWDQRRAPPHAANMASYISVLFLSFNWWFSWPVIKAEAHFLLFRHHLHCEDDVGSWNTSSSEAGELLFWGPAMWPSSQSYPNASSNNALTENRMGGPWHFHF